MKDDNKGFRRPKGFRIEHLALILLLATPSAAAQSDPASPDRDASGVKSTSVPVNITVLDASGNPRLDLTATDFEILEEGAPQKLHSFTLPQAAQNISPIGEEPGSAVRPRHFLFLVGDLGGDPFDAIGDLADFVAGLGPRDHVALMAYRRVSDFTNRHKETAAALRDYRKVHTKTDALMQRYVQARVLLDSRTAPRLPDSVRTGVREFFEKHGWTSRELPPPAYQAVQLSDFDHGAPDVNPFDAARIGLLSGLPLDKSITGLDFSQLVTAIDLLSYREGDRLLFFLNARGFRAPNEQLDWTARFASAGQVRVYAFETAGTDPSPLASNRVTRNLSRREAPEPIRSIRRWTLGPLDQTPSQADKLGSLQILARDSGGVAYLRASVSDGLQSALRHAEAAYRLSYLPANLDGEPGFRKIQARVKQPNLALYHRAGRLSVSPPSRGERFESLIPLRAVAAVKQDDYLTDIGLVLAAARRADSPEASHFEVRTTARFPERIFQAFQGSRRSELVVAYFLVDGQKAATVFDRLDLRLTESEFRTAIKEGFEFRRHLAVPKNLSDSLLKVVVYHPGQDLLGSVELQLPK